MKFKNPKRLNTIKKYIKLKESIQAPKLMQIFMYLEITSLMAHYNSTISDILLNNHPSITKTLQKLD